MTGTEGIQIYVACHKPTWVLDNRLLVPVQVGAALTDARYAGMRQDNECSVLRIDCSVLGMEKYRL